MSTHEQHILYVFLTAVLWGLIPQHPRPSIQLPHITYSYLDREHKTRNSIRFLYIFEMKVSSFRRAVCIYIYIYNKNAIELDPIFSCWLS